MQSEIMLLLEQYNITLELQLYINAYDTSTVHTVLIHITSNYSYIGIRNIFIFIQPHRIVRKNKKKIMICFYVSCNIYI